MEELARPPQEPIAQPTWKPSANYARKSYEINIKFLDRGVHVQVGCKNIAFETVDKFLEEFNNYVKNPVEVQEFWLKEFGD